MATDAVVTLKCRWRRRWLIGPACWLANGAAHVGVPPRYCARIANSVLRFTPIDVSASGSRRRIFSFVPRVEAVD